MFIISLADFNPSHGFEYPVHDKYMPKSTVHRKIY